MLHRQTIFFRGAYLHSFFCILPSVPVLYQITVENMLLKKSIHCNQTEKYDFIVCFQWRFGIKRGDQAVFNRGVMLLNFFEGLKK